MDISPLPRYLQNPARRLLRRCVQCPDITPACPACADNQECSYDIGGCDSCPQNKCIAKPGATDASSGSSPAGPIAGGVVGGIAVVSIIVFLVYWFYIRRKREQDKWILQQQLEEIRSQNGGGTIGDRGPEKTDAEYASFQEQRSKRGSTHTVASVKTTGSRTSNVIQIAYIPGVTNRSDATSPEMIPPVPPIPAAGTTSPHLNTGSEQFFMIGGLSGRESGYSDHFGADRRSLGGRSLARSSVAASEYHHDSVVDPMPARAAVAARAVPISIKSGQSRVGSPTHSPPLSHQNSIASRMHGAGPITGQSGQARQVYVTRSQSNLRQQPLVEMEDTSPSPTPRLGVDRSGTASPRSLLSDDGEYVLRKNSQGWGHNSGQSHHLMGGRSPGSPNNPPVSAVQSTFSRNSPVSAYGWEGGNSAQHANARDTIQNAMVMGYGQPLHNIAELDADTQSKSSDLKSPFADRHAANTP